MGDERAMPGDARPAKEVAEATGVPYDTLKYWWRNRKISSWVVGRFRYVSEREVRAVWAEWQRPKYSGPLDVLVVLGSPGT